MKQEVIEADNSKSVIKDVEFSELYPHIKHPMLNDNYFRLMKVILKAQLAEVRSN